MRKIFTLLVLLSVVFCQINAQKYFVSFTDKNNNTYSIDAPEEFLTQKAIDRRAKHSINIDETDLPVTAAYVDAITDLGVKVLNTSKWLNGAIIETDNSTIAETIQAFEFVSECVLVYNRMQPSNIRKFISNESGLKSQTTSIDYGLAWGQTLTVNGQDVHKMYNGEGIIIAVLDAGFYHVNSLPAFDHLWENNQIIESYDFVNPDGDVYQENSHGMKVLSIIGGFVPGEYKGSAIKADFLLYRTEDNSSEYRIEEYNWLCAAERADYMGADIITSSLGYFEFDDPSMNYTYEDMNGQNTVVVKGAEMAFLKGMFVINSAGNEGSKSWKYIISPGDGENVLTVGAMSSDSITASFSSYGPSFDDRVKPDVTAVGVNTSLQLTDGTMGKGNGTSFSTPVIAGFVACAWQAQPELTNEELLLTIKINSHLYNSPGVRMGYGIPDFVQITGVDIGVKDLKKEPFKLLTNPFRNYIEITSEELAANISVTVYNISGMAVAHKTFPHSNPIQLNGLSHLQSGIYICEVEYDNRSQVFKLIKR